MSREPGAAQYFHLSQEFWKILPGGLPNDFNVDIEVGMDNPIAHANNVLPGKVRMGFPKLRREPVSSFTDDLNAADHGMLKWTVLPKLGESCPET